MRSHLAALALVLFTAASPAARGAGPDRSDPRVAARALAEHGYSLYEAGKYTEAISVFQEAERLYHAPTIMLALARAHAASGKLVEARALYQRVLAEKLAPGAPLAFGEAQRSAATELPGLEQRLPAVQILVRGGGGGGLRVMVDDADVEGWSPDRFVPQNPGPHRVTAVPAGGVGVSRTVDLREGARSTVELELPGAGPTEVRPEIGAPSAPPPPRPWLVPALMGFGVGAVGLGVGLGAGISTLGTAAALRGRCPGHVCPPTAQNRADISGASGMAAASTVGFVFAGAGAVTGVVLLVVRPGGATRARATLELGPASIGVSGVF
jgi:hypothetical protein